MIRLRVVGVFYDKEFKAEGIKTIKDLLVRAQITSNGRFSYEALTSDKDMGTGIKVFTHTLDKTLNPTLGGQTRPEGTYSLSFGTFEEAGCTVARVWQYYVISNGRSVSNCYRGDPNEDSVSPAEPSVELTKFVRFDHMPIRDLDEVVWRNVSIVRRPQPAK
jgi:hypothetical protein